MSMNKFDSHSSIVIFLYPYSFLIDFIELLFFLPIALMNKAHFAQKQYIPKKQAVARDNSFCIKYSFNAQYEEMISI